jgi:hypothetical protein
MNLRALNSLTKYPSISTYHALGEKGRLTEDRMPLSGRVIAREKIDGTNARILLTPDGYYLGSREELLHFQGDRIWNPALGIVEALRPIAEVLQRPNAASVVFYGEVYGGNVTPASKQYTGQRAVGFRLFDVATLPDWRERIEQPPEQIAAWREGGGQAFLHEDDLRIMADRSDLALCPPVYDGDASAIPTEHAAVLAWLREHIRDSLARLDESGGGKPEGVVIRTADRKTTVKVRYEDYERTLKQKGRA